MTILLFHQFIHQQRLVGTWLGARWCDAPPHCGGTKSAGPDLPEEVVGILFQTNPGAVLLRCESERTSVRSSAKSIRLYGRNRPPLSGGDGMSIGYLGRRPHKTYAGKHTECRCI